MFEIGSLLQFVALAAGRKNDNEQDEQDRIADSEEKRRH